VRLLAHTKLRALAGVPALEVVSRHHQAVAGVQPPWIVAGADGEDLIEAIERQEHPFALGVQWHPELSSDPDHARLFVGLVEAARQYAGSAIPPALPRPRPGERRARLEPGVPGTDP